MQDTPTITSLTKKLIDFNTENFDNKPGGYTLELLKYVQELLMQNGIKSKIYGYQIERIIDGNKFTLDKRGILISEYENKKPIILLQGHADTVPIAKRFGSENCLVKKNIIYGRGAVDMKSSLAAMILALIELKKNQNLQYQPMLLVTSDEEAGSFAGIKKFIELYRQTKPNIKYAICGEATGFEIKHNFLGAIFLRFRFAGKSGHAANKKHGDNAIEKAVPFLNDLVRFQKKIEKEKNSLGQAVMNIGTIRGGKKVNQIPTSCEIEVSLRSIKKNSYYEKELSSLARKNGSRMEKVFSYEPTTLSAQDDLVRQLHKSLNANKKQETIMKEFTEATLLNESGIKTAVFGPGNPLLNHSDQEQIKIADIAHYQNVLEKFVTDAGRLD